MYKMSKGEQKKAQAIAKKITDIDFDEHSKDATKEKMLLFKGLTIKECELLCRWKETNIIGVAKWLRIPLPRAFRRKITDKTDDLPFKDVFACFPVYKS